MSNARNLSKLIPSSTGLIQTANITDDAITNAKIGAGAVTNTEVNASAIASSKLGTIGTDKMPSGSIIQTLSMTLTEPFAQGNSYTDTGLTLDITPISMSTVLVTGFGNVVENYFRSYIIAVRDSTTLAVGESPVTDHKYIRYSYKRYV